MDAAGAGAAYTNGTGAKTTTSVGGARTAGADAPDTACTGAVHSVLAPQTQQTLALCVTCHLPCTSLLLQQQQLTIGRRNVSGFYWLVLALIGAGHSENGWS